MAGTAFFRNFALGAARRVSTAAGGAEGDAAARNARLSDDGAIVVFESLAANLVAGDTNAAYDIFRRDTATGEVARVSENAAGALVSGISLNARFNADATAALFDSHAPDLVAGDTNARRDVFLKDFATGAIRRLSTSAAGVEGNLDSQMAVFSPDGGRVAFESQATNLIGLDTNAARDIFVKTPATGQISRVSVDAVGAQANGQSANAAFSPDGRHLLFESNATNLVGGDGNASYDLFLKDLTTGAIRRVSTTAAGGEANGHSFRGQFTTDGQSIVFESLASNLVDGDTNAARDIFEKNLETGAVRLISRGIGGAPANGTSQNASVGGDWIAYESNATNLVPGDSSGRRDVVLTNRVTGETVRALTAEGDEPSNELYNGRLSADGRTLVYETAAPIEGADTNAERDVYLASVMEAVDTAVIAADSGPVGGQLFFDDTDTAAAHALAITRPADPLGQFAAAITLSAAGAGVGAIVWTFTPEADALPAGEVAERRFGLALGGATTEVIVTLTGLNDAPRAAADTLAMGAGQMRAMLAPLLLGNDRDPDTGDSFAVVSVDTTGTIGRVGFDAVTGALEYHADAAAQRALAPGAALTDHFAYTVRDAGGATATATVTITVSGEVPLAPRGTEAPDTLTGTPAADVIDAGDGDDSVSGLAGADTLIGGAGADTLDGGAGVDALDGGPGDDLLKVDDPRDTAEGGPGADTVLSSTPTAQLAPETETLRFAGVTGAVAAGNAAANRIEGTAGADRLDGGGGGDTLVGGAGDDVYEIDTLLDLVIEAAGGGADTIVSTVSLRLPAEVEILRLAGAATDATGNAAANQLHGTAAANRLDGGAGGDTLTGLGGGDTYVVDSTADRVIEAASGGTDTVLAHLARYTLPANVENLEFAGALAAAGARGQGNASANIIIGLAGPDLLYGFAGDDLLIGGAGDDLLDGGAGADRLRGGAGIDTFALRKGEADGDHILDFAGDRLQLLGWGAGSTVTQGAADDWRIVDGRDGAVATFRLTGEIVPAEILFG